MSLLSADELAYCRDMAEEAMPDTCTIQTRTETNTKGSIVVSYASTYTNVKCRMMPVNRGTGETWSGMKISDEAEYILTVPYDQSLSARDRVYYKNCYYEVIRVHSEHSYRTAVRAETKLVDGGE